MMASTAVLNLCMVLFHRQMSASLGPDYRQLSALLAVFNVLGVLTSGLSTTTAKIFSRDAALRGPGAVSSRLWSLGPFLAGVMASLAILSTALGPWLTAFLKLGSLAVYTPVVLLSVLTFFMGLVRSAIQGLHRFGVLGSSLIFQGMVQVGAAAVLVWQGWGVRGAMLGASLGALAGALYCLPPLLAGRAVSPTLPRLAAPERRGVALEMVKDSAALGLFNLLCFLDIFAVNHSQAEGAASFYSRAALVAKSFLYAALALNLVLLPLTAAARARGSDPRPLLLKFLGFMAALMAAGLALVVWQTGPVVGLLCGPDPAFQRELGLVRFFCAAVIPVACYQLLLLYQLSAGLAGTLRLELLVVGLYALALSFFHQDLWQVVACLAGAGILALLGGLALSLFSTSQGQGGVLMAEPEMGSIGSPE
jgi:hypothetical protein